MHPKSSGLECSVQSTEPGNPMSAWKECPHRKFDPPAQCVQPQPPPGDQPVPFPITLGSQRYQDGGPCQLQLRYSGILMNRVSKRLQQKPLNSIEQQPNEPNYKQCTLRLLEEGQELSRRIQIQIKHDMLCFRDFNTCSEEILVGGFTPNQKSGKIAIVGWKIDKCFIQTRLFEHQ